MLYLQRLTGQRSNTTRESPDRQMLLILNPVGFFWSDVDYKNMKATETTEISFAFTPLQKREARPPNDKCISKEAILTIIKVIEGILS